MLARISFYGLMLALVAGFAQQAIAQPGQRGGFGGNRGGFGGGMGGGFFNPSEADLLNRGNVKEELNLSDDQAKQLREAEAEARKEMAKALRAKIQSILTEGQKTRFTEIVAQSPGLGLTSAMIQETLKVSDDQKKKLAEIQANVQKEMASIGFDREAGEKRQEIRKEADTKMLDVLTSEQKAAFDKLKENKFESGFGGGRGGQGGERGNRGGRNRDGGDKGGKRPEPEL